jgi:hypothetical protein
VIQAEEVGVFVTDEEAKEADLSVPWRIASQTA